MVPCEFMEGGNCTGLVHDRFQVGFLQVCALAVKSACLYIYTVVAPDRSVCPVHIYTPTTKNTPFPNSFKQLMDKCQAEVGQLKGKKVLVTGHSLGGAMALFMTLKLWQVGECFETC